jgi:hypothetical protein
VQWPTRDRALLWAGLAILFAETVAHIGWGRPADPSVVGAALALLAGDLIKAKRDESGP